MRPLFLFVEVVEGERKGVDPWVGGSTWWCRECVDEVLTEIKNENK